MATPATGVDLARAIVIDPTLPADWLVVAPSILTILGGAICLMARKNTEAQPRVAILFLTLLVLACGGLFVHVLDKGVVNMVMGRWLPPFGIAFTADITGAALALTASIVALAAGIYGAVDIDTSGRRYGFYPFLLLLMTGVCGAFLTGDIFNLYVWFEVLLISSFGMLVLGNEKEQLDGAVKYAVLNIIATTLFLISTGLLYGLFGTLNMADIAIKTRESGLTGPLASIAVLYLLAFGMKAAAFPVNFWLPASYHTPRIVVSAVFAGLLTKVGVYALLRIFILLMPQARIALTDVIALVAIATMITGIFGALAQTDIRRLFGYLVISGIGSMLAGLAIGTTAAVAGTIFYAIHSVIVMTALYMAAGIMHSMGGSYSLRKLGGLYGASPAFAAVFLVLAFGVAGLPPFSGFWPKVILVDAALATGHGWLAGTILLTGLLTSIAVGRVWVFAFWRGGAEGTVDGGAVALPAADPVLTRAAVWLPLGVLLTLVVLLGVLPEPFFQISGRGASGLVDPLGYVRAVFGGSL
ncbi:Na+/H+ antiporter subunit D [Stappia sp. F7233]|uniref:Na+/H+ antiporter subunit D n=1 Tax=Stappia albiluteola TaxID=2758565 RepID=A0A839AKT0_9HYPH|nr:Na+/H+ antiporter subunit D [Stappia albiluteola]MBA5779059.1 Na+/H+ antiporter subunit D [Stappia albiluteola]